MTLRFTTPHDHPNARIVAMSGGVAVGAIFPCARGRKTAFAWRLWVNGKSHPTEGEAKKRAAAETALSTAWRDFLHRAGLEEKG